MCTVTQQHKMAIKQNKSMQLFGIETYIQRWSSSACVTGPEEVMHWHMHSTQTFEGFSTDCRLCCKYLPFVHIETSEERLVVRSPISNSILFTLLMQLHQMQPSWRSRYDRQSRGWNSFCQHPCLPFSPPFTLPLAVHLLPLRRRWLDYHFGSKREGWQKSPWWQCIL